MPFRTTEQTFNLKSCCDLIEKLHREIERLRSSSSRQEAADFGFKCAVTTYHICDWARREAGFADDQMLQGCYVWNIAQAACSSDQRHALSDSRYICNTSKHGCDDSATTIQMYASATMSASVAAGTTAQITAPSR